METYFVMFCAVVIPLFYIYQPTNARHYLLALGTAAFVLFGMSTGLFVKTPGTSMFHVSDLRLAGFGVLAVMSGAWAANTRESITDAVTWLSYFALYYAAGRVPVEIVMLSLYTPAVVMLPVVAYQVYSERRYGQVIETNGVRLVTMPAGIFGNTNYCGVYMTIVFFVGLWLADNISPWFFVPQGLILMSIYLTKCKAAWVAWAAGMAVTCYHMGYVFMAAVLLVISLCFLGLQLLRIKGSPYESSGSARISFYLNALNLIRKRPLFGWGLRSFRIEQFYSQKDLEKISPRFAKMSAGLTDRVHNDYLEILVETGVIGFGLFAWFLFCLPWHADPALSGGMAAMLASALFFFPFYTAHTSIVFWCMAGVATGMTPGTVAFSAPPYLTAVLLAIFLFLVYCYPLKKLIAVYYWIHKAPQATDKAALLKITMKCLKYDPYNSLYLHTAYGLTAPYNPKLAMNCAVRLHEHFDGNIPFEAIELLQPKIVRSEE